MKMSLLPLKAIFPAALILASAQLSGCGSNPNPCVYGTSISILSLTNHVPVTGSADHSAAPPGNQFQFRAEGGSYVVSGDHCAVPAVVGPVDLNWTSSDPKDVTMDSSAGETNGTATCLNATSSSVTVTGTPHAGTGIYNPTSVTGILSCK
jgi:hypothetical protein